MVGSGRVRIRGASVAVAFGSALGILAGGLTAPAASAAPAACRLVGTVGLPELGTDPQDTGFAALRRPTVRLPERVDFRTETESFNRRWAFAARDGRLYVSRVDGAGGWRIVALPSCLDGNVAGISADDDEAMVTDRAGRFHVLDRALSSPRDWNWSTRYGAPLWTGPGNDLPAGTEAWTWSVLSPSEDRVWRDDAGNDHPVGGAKVSHVFALTDRGTRIRYMDPWLPVDHSYELGLPAGGRFRAVALSTSGSTSFVINRYGDMYTRLYDFDISGADTVFFRYSYESQRGRPEPLTMIDGRFAPWVAAIQLPAPGWIRQPKIDGTITSTISVHKTGVGSDARELRVEGTRGGRSGYWQKTVAGATWTFVPTGRATTGRPLENTAGDRSIDPTVPTPGYDYRGRGPRGWTAEVRGFDVAQTPTPLSLDLGDGQRVQLVLHTVDALRQLPQEPGIGAQPRTFDGTIEVPASTRATAPPRVRTFLDSELGGRRFTSTPVVATAGRLRIDALGTDLPRSRD